MHACMEGGEFGSSETLRVQLVLHACLPAAVASHHMSPQNGVVCVPVLVEGCEVNTLTSTLRSTSTGSLLGEHLQWQAVQRGSCGDDVCIW